MSTVTIEIPETSLKALQVLAEAENISDAVLAGRVLTEYVASFSTVSREDETERDREALDAAFGIWADRGEDGLAYQLRLRAEWPD